MAALSSGGFWDLDLNPQIHHLEFLGLKKREINEMCQCGVIITSKGHSGEGLAIRQFTHLDCIPVQAE